MTGTDQTTPQPTAETGPPTGGRTRVPAFTQEWNMPTAPVSGLGAGFFLVAAADGVAVMATAIAADNVRNRPFVMMRPWVSSVGSAESNEFGSQKRSWEVGCDSYAPEMRPSGMPFSIPAKDHSSRGLLSPTWLADLASKAAASSRKATT